MSTIVLRVVAFFCVLVSTLVLSIDFQMMAGGRPESTMLWLLIKIGERTNQPSWMAVVMWIMPLWMGVFILLMPRRLFRPTRSPRRGDIV